MDITVVSQAFNDLCKNKTKEEGQKLEGSLLACLAKINLFQFQALSISDVVDDSLPRL